jgi:hypothetical protein
MYAHQPTLIARMVNSSKRRLSVSAKKTGLTPSPKSVAKNRDTKRANLLDHFTSDNTLSTAG